MTQKARAMMLADVANRRGPNRFKKNDIVWIAPSFPGRDNNFFNIVTGPEDGRPRSLVTFTARRSGSALGSGGQ